MKLKDLLKVVKTDDLEILDWDVTEISVTDNKKLAIKLKEPLKMEKTTDSLARRAMVCERKRRFLDD